MRDQHGQKLIFLWVHLSSLGLNEPAAALLCASHPIFWDQLEGIMWEFGCGLFSVSCFQVVRRITTFQFRKKNIIYATR